jgi:hypothetical protein
VDQGYATQRYSAPTTPYSSPEKSKPPSTSATLFRSAADTLHDVFASPEAEIPLSESPSKRNRACYEDEDEFVVDGDGDAAMQVIEGGLDQIAASKDTRPVKPLRPRKRSLAKSVSLPPGLLFASQSAKHLDGLGNMKVEERWCDTDLNASVNINASPRNP